MKLWDDPKVNKIWLKKQTKSDFQFQLTMKSCDDQKVNYIRLKSELHIIFSSNSVIMGWLKITWFHSKLGLKTRCCSLFSQTFLSSHDLMGVKPFLPSPSLPGQVCPDQVCPAKFARNPNLPRAKFAPTQICPVPFLPQPNLPRPIFAQNWIWLPFIQKLQNFKWNWKKK